MVRIDLLEAGKVLWMRTVGFPKDERMRFLELIQTQTAQGRTPAQIYRGLSEYGPTAQVRSIAAESLSNKSRGSDFTESWADNGCFPRRDGMLLNLGERRNAISDITEMLARDQDPAINYWKVVIGKNVTWMISLLMMVAACVYLEGQSDLFMRFMSETPDFVIYGRFIKEWSIPGTVIFGLGVGGYIHAARVTPSEVRAKLREGLVFAAQDRLFAMSVCDLLGVLMRIGEPKVGSTIAVRDIFQGHPQRREALSDMIESLNRGQTMANALYEAGVLEERYANYLMSLAESDSRAHVARAMPTVLTIIREDIKNNFDTLKLFVMMGCLIPTGMIGYALMPLMLGTGISVQP